MTWGALAVAAIVGANTLGPALFEALGFACGVYLIYLGWRAVTTRKGAKPRTIGASRPLATGMAFGLTNPKSYPVALAMFSAIVAPYIGALHAADAPQMFVAAFAGFLLADATLIFAAGLPAVRKFFLTHGVAVTRVVGRDLHPVRRPLYRRRSRERHAPDGVSRLGSACCQCRCPQVAHCSSTKV